MVARLERGSSTPFAGRSAPSISPGRGTAFSIPGLHVTANTPQWSPDDATIAFTAGAPAPDIRVYVIGADGSGLRRIA